MEGKVSEKQMWISKVIWIYLFLSPLFDVITSFWVHTFQKSMFLILGIKVSFLLFLFIINCFQKEKKSIWYSLILLLYFFVFFGFTCAGKEFEVFFLEGQNLFRTFYFPCVFLFLFSLQKRGLFEVSISKLCIVLLLYLFFLVVPEIFHVGFQSYAITKVGGLGWFYSTNEISGILAILGPFFLVYLKQKNWTFRILGLLFYGLGIFVIGTKVPILAFAITLLCFFFSFLLKLLRQKKWKQVWLSGGLSFLVIFLFVLLLPYTSFYKNIRTHLEFLEIHEVKDLFTYHHIDHFVFSERLSFLEQTHALYKSSSGSRKIVGLGILNNTSDSYSVRKMIEMDYFDIFYCYGVLGTILFYLPFFFYFWKRKYTLAEKVSLFLIVLLALFSGHIFVAPSVSAIVTLVLLPKKDVVQ